MICQHWGCWPSSIVYYQAHAAAVRVPKSSLSTTQLYKQRHLCPISTNLVRKARTYSKNNTPTTVLCEFFIRFEIYSSRNSSTLRYFSVGIVYPPDLLLIVNVEQAPYGRNFSAMVGDLNEDNELDWESSGLRLWACISGSDTVRVRI